MTRVEFRNYGEQTIHKTDMPQVPSKDDLVEIDGARYWVDRVTWQPDTSSAVITVSRIPEE